MEAQITEDLIEKYCFNCKHYKSRKVKCRKLNIDLTPQENFKKFCNELYFKNHPFLIRGWLLVLFIFIVVFKPVIIFTEGILSYRAILTYEKILSDSNNNIYLNILETSNIMIFFRLFLILSIPMLLFIIYTAYVMLNKNYAVKVLRIFISVNLIYSLFIEFIRIGHTYNYSIAFTQMFLSVVIFVSWMVYLGNSKRVKATYKTEK